MAATASTNELTLSNATEKIGGIFTYIQEFLVRYAIQVLGAIIIGCAGLFVARWIGGRLAQSLERKGIEPPVRMLFVRLVKLLVLALTVVIASKNLGVEIAPLIAGLGVAGVGVGLAMQGVLGNLVAGLTIIFTKPYRVGDYIEIHGVHGQVEQIELFSTLLTHSDKSRVIIPNRKIVGEILHNYGTVRQLDMTIGVSYDTDIPAALDLVRGILKNNSRVLKQMTPGVGVAALSDSTINISVRPWVAVPDYGAAQGEIYQAILEQFRAQKIDLPFPQREIRIVNGTGTGEPASRQISA